mmetsp:Transcript_4663/g.4844  ORF Transcript_4663/g.4844 Transcript_4663/m.4844 type:complete len:109 (-) Transcript_4663:133-459(-)
METNLNQSLTILGEDGKEFKPKSKASSTANNLFLDSELTKIALDSQKNYDKALLSMMKVCSNACVKSFKIDRLTKTEENCLKSCQYNYMNTVSIGRDVINHFLQNERK